MKNKSLYKILFLPIFVIFLITASLQPVQAQTSLPKTSTPPPSNWQTPVQLAQDVPQIDGLALAVDSQGRVHAVWSQGDDPTGPTTSLVYTGVDKQGATSTLRMVQAAQGEMARQPSMLVDGRDRLHLVYSGGQTGEIFYTSADAALAGSSGGWHPPRVVSYAQGTYWPQIGLAPDGTLYIVYVVPFNETRGVYWLRSSDGGETWTAPALVFDAAKSGWQAVGHAALAISPDDSLQIVFEQASLPGEWSVQGLYYTSSSPQIGTLSFTPPDSIAPAGSSMPQLAITGSQLHLVYDGQVGLETRRLDLTATGSSWGGVEHLNGWQFGLAGEQSFGLAADAQNAHLLSPLPDGYGIRFSDWLGVKGTGWTNPPELVDFPQPPTNNIPTATPTVNRVYLGTPTLTPTPSPLDNGIRSASASRLTGGVLAVAWVNQAGQGMQAYLVLRSIPQVSALSISAIPPTLTDTPAPTSTPTQPAASPTPNLNEPSGDSALPVNPMYLGGGLAALIVVLALGAYLLLAGRRR